MTWMPYTETVDLISNLWKALGVWVVIDASIREGRKRRAQRWAEKAAAKENFQHQVEEFARKSIEDSQR
jgi:hypothetical protein